MNMACSVEACERPSQARGWCITHYRRWQRRGDPVAPRITPPRTDPVPRFWARVVKGPGCWTWTGSHMPEGYGIFQPVPGRRVGAHRYAYQLLVGPIPDSLTLDHLCRSPSCVNPAHLEPVTMRVNVLRGVGPSAVNAVKTHCKYGHPLPHVWRGERVCSICRAAANRRWRANRRAQKSQEIAA